MCAASGKVQRMEMSAIIELVKITVSIAKLVISVVTYRRNSEK